MGFPNLMTYHMSIITYYNTNTHVLVCQVRVHLVYS